LGIAAEAQPPLRYLLVTSIATLLSKFSAGSCVDFLLARMLSIIKDLFRRPRYILIADFALVNSDALYWIRKNSGSSVWIAGNTSLDTVKSQGQVCSALARHFSKYRYTVAFFMPAAGAAQVTRDFRG
jgi:hypothetical protein